MELIVAMADISVNGRYNAGEPVMETMQQSWCGRAQLHPEADAFPCLKHRLISGLCLGFAVQRLQTSRREAASCVEMHVQSERGVVRIHFQPELIAAC